MRVGPLLVLLLATLACGRDPGGLSSVDGGAADSQRDGVAADQRPGDKGDSAVDVPAACRVAPPATSSPYAVTFRLKNPSSAAVWLSYGCGVVFDLGACPDYQPLPFSAGCACRCDSCSMCPMCGPCMQHSESVGAGATVEKGWSGELFPVMRVDGCVNNTCYTPMPASAGRYRVSVPVFASEADARMRKLLRTAKAEFELPAPGGAVDVSLGP